LKNGHFDGCTGCSCICEERRYWLVLGISLGIAALELVGGYISGSLALASDGGHVLVDALAAAVAITVARSVRMKKGSEAALRRRGGYMSSVLLAAVAATITWGAIPRLFSPPQITGYVMVAVATLGGLGNYVQHRILREAHENHVTHQGIHWHVLSDLWQSVAVVAGAVAILLTGCQLIDPVLSLIIAGIILHWAWVMYKHSSQLR